jgi:hypothetical protein
MKNFLMPKILIFTALLSVGGQSLASSPVLLIQLEHNSYTMTHGDPKGVRNQDVEKVKIELTPAFLAGLSKPTSAKVGGIRCQIADHSSGDNGAVFGNYGEFVTLAPQMSGKIMVDMMPYPHGYEMVNGTKVYLGNPQNKIDASFGRWEDVDLTHKQSFTSGTDTTLASVDFNISFKVVPAADPSLNGAVTLQMKAPPKDAFPSIPAEILIGEASLTSLQVKCTVF